MFAEGFLFWGLINKVSANIMRFKGRTRIRIGIGFFWKKKTKFMFVFGGRFDGSPGVWDGGNQN